MACQRSSPRASPKGKKVRLVERPTYRQQNLEENGISLITGKDKDYPPEVARLVAAMGKVPEHQTLTMEDVQNCQELDDLWEIPAEARVISFLKRTLFPEKPQGAAGRVLDEGQPMEQGQIPKKRHTLHNVSKPKPDMLYGYDRRTLTQADHLKGAGASANKAGLLFPFLVVEVKADEPLRVAINQCLGGASACVLIANRLNNELWDLRDDQAVSVQSAAFSVAVNGTVANLYVTWFDKIEQKYLTRQVRAFRLSACHPGEFLEFHQHIQNILHWGHTIRLEQIKAGLKRLQDLKPGVQAVTPTSPPSSNTRSKGARHQVMLDQRARRPLVLPSQITPTPALPAEHSAPFTPDNVGNGNRKRTRTSPETADVTDDSTFQDDPSMPANKRRTTRLTDPFQRRASLRAPSRDENAAHRAASSNQTTIKDSLPAVAPPAVPHHSRPLLAPITEQQTRRPEGEETPAGLLKSLSQCIPPLKNLFPG